MVKEYFEGKSNLRSINKTNLVLIPKVDRPESVGHFCLISLCNFSYKILSKVITNRMKDLLPKFISQHQRAFVSGRLIQDNIVIAHEVFHYLKEKRRGGNYEYALKMDMNKAYDHFVWDFLSEVLLKLGFDWRWVQIVMGCVSSVNFSLLLSGSSVGDVLSTMISHHVLIGELKGVKLARYGPTLSHCYFADDALFFMKAAKEPVRSLDPSCSFVTPPTLWKAICSVNAVPKVRNFLLRSCTNSIPTCEALFKRKCALSPLCHICGKEVETIEHALLLCRWVREVWFGGPLSIRISTSLVSRFDVWAQAFLVENKDLEDSGRVAFAYTCWEVWKRRCDVIFKGVDPNPSSCILKLGVATSEAVMAHKKTALGGFMEDATPKALNCWSFPPAGVIKINVDGSFHQSHLDAGIGYIARSGSREALEMVHDFLDDSFILETDCEDLFKLVSSPKSFFGEWQCEAVIEDVLSLISLCHFVSFSLVRRKGNQAADWLAKDAAKGLG
ncbi:reverse transcriptase [Senna tora]|uniref:Reverse transcriptase n=1 Tax=Senna tora TaxID=362788 RepID=A0A834SR30_9FABA|nr:reverse transcriptase [Senna tora]